MNQRQRSSVRTNWRPFAAVCVIGIALLVVLVRFVSNDFLRGLAVGSIGVSTVLLLVLVIEQLPGTASIEMGADAEEWTIGELRPLQRAGWRILHRLSLQTWDIDHVVVGPNGILAVATKWSSYGWKLDSPEDRLVRAIAQARRNANRLSQWHEVRAAGFTRVEPVVFAWGRHSDKARSAAQPQVINGVTVVYGAKAAKAWRATLTATASTEHSADQVEWLWDALDSHARVRDEHSHVDPPTSPRTFWYVYWNAVSVIVAAAGGVLAAGILVRVSAWWVATISIAALFALGLATRRVQILRMASIGWLTAVAGTFVVGLGLALVHEL